MNETTIPEPCEEVSSVRLSSAGGGRPGAVEMDGIQLIPEPVLEASEPYRQMTDRLRASEAIVESMRRRGAVATDVLLTEALDTLVREGQVDGLLVGSEDGFVIARSSGLDGADILAVIGTVFEYVVRRVQSEGMMVRVDEMSARGAAGEQIVMRYFPGAESRFFLLAYSRQPATYRRTMARALKRCGDILAGRPGGVVRRRASVRAPAAAELEGDGGAGNSPGAVPDAGDGGPSVDETAIVTAVATAVDAADAPAVEPESISLPSAKAAGENNNPIQEPPDSETSPWPR